MRQTSTGAKAGKMEFKGAFVATMPTGHRGIFKRKTKSRLPICEVVPPLEPIASNIIKGFVDSVTDMVWRVEWAHELHRGDSVWTASCIQPHTVYVGIAPEIGAANEPDYIEVPNGEF